MCRFKQNMIVKQPKALHQFQIVKILYLAFIKSKEATRVLLMLFPSNTGRMPLRIHPRQAPDLSIQRAPFFSFPLSVNCSTKDKIRRIPTAAICSQCNPTNLSCYPILKVPVLQLSLIPYVKYHLYINVLSDVLVNQVFSKHDY